MLIFDEMDLENPLKIYNQYANYPKLDYFSKNFLKSKVYIYKGSSKNIKINATPSLENEILHFLNSNKIENRITKKIPATTSVDECIRAEAGVGASIASGSHTCEKNWAAFIAPEVTRQNENKVIKCRAELPKKI